MYEETYLMVVASLQTRSKVMAVEKAARNAKQEATLLQQLFL